MKNTKPIQKNCLPIEPTMKTKQKVLIITGEKWFAEYRLGNYEELIFRLEKDIEFNEIKELQIEVKEFNVSSLVILRKVIGLFTEKNLNITYIYSDSDSKIMGKEIRDNFSTKIKIKPKTDE